MAIDYDVPPPPPEEVIYVERPVLAFDDPGFGFAPPPPPPVYFLAPPPPEFVVLEPPPPVYGAYILPVPAFVPVPVYVSSPRYVVAPPNASRNLDDYIDTSLTDGLRAEGFFAAMGKKYARK